MQSLTIAAGSHLHEALLAAGSALQGALKRAQSEGAKRVRLLPAELDRLTGLTATLMTVEEPSGFADYSPEDDDDDDDTEYYY